MTTPAGHVAVLEIGGTHAESCWVDPVAQHAYARTEPEPVESDADAAVVIDAWAARVQALPHRGRQVLAVAAPGPFDYAAGIARYSDVGKFDALAGLDVGAELAVRLDPPPAHIGFVNDAAAFGLGVWWSFDIRPPRLVAITLGTGIGSAFVAGGRIVDSGPDVPPNGYAYRIDVDGVPLEDVVSRRAILARYRDAGGEPDLDVTDVAARAAGGDPAARAGFVEPMTDLGAALKPWIRSFGADVLVVGGAMSASWELVSTALARGLGPNAPRVVRCADPMTATAVGAAAYVTGAVRATVRR